MAADVIDVSQFIIDRLNATKVRTWRNNSNETMMCNASFEVALYYSQAASVASAQVPPRPALFQDDIEVLGPVWDRHLLPKRVYDHIQSKSHRRAFQELTDDQKENIGDVVATMSGFEKRTIYELRKELMFNGNASVSAMHIRYGHQEKESLLDDICGSLWGLESVIQRQLETAKISMPVPIYGCAVSVDSLTQEMKTMDVDKALELCRKHLGCGDNSCRFVKTGGMATNGGCRCQDRPLVMASLAALYKAVEATKVKKEDGQ